MAMNVYYRYDGESKRLERMPAGFEVGGAFVVNPPREAAAAVGAYPLSDADPPVEVPSGKVPVQDGYRLEDGAWVPEYRYEDAPPGPPRVFSKLKVCTLLMEAGAWDGVKAYIQDNGLYDLYLAAQEFSEDNRYFKDGVAALQAELGWTDEDVERLLAASVKD